MVFLVYIILHNLARIFTFNSIYFIYSLYTTYYYTYFIFSIFIFSLSQFKNQNHRLSRWFILALWGLFYLFWFTGSPVNGSIYSFSVIWSYSKSFCNWFWIYSCISFKNTKKMLPHIWFIKSLMRQPLVNIGYSCILAVFW